MPRPLALGALALLLGACGSGPSSTAGAAVDDPLVTSASAAPSASATTPAAPRGTGAPGAGQHSSGGASSSQAGSGTPGARPGSATRTGAAPGDYPEIISSSSNAPGATPMPPHPGTLRVSPAQPAADGASQTERSFDRDGRGLVFVTLVRPSGQIDLGSVASENTSRGCTLTLDFSPPIESVPAALATGTTWNGPVHTTNLDGTYSGSVGPRGSDTVGGASVAIWKLHLSLQLRGTVCGFAGTAAVTVDEDWAPSISLPTLLATASDIVLAFGTYHVTSSVQLQSLRPS